MGRGRSLPRLTLTAEDRETLQGWSRLRKTEQALALRSRIVLRASTGLKATAIALELGVCIQTVSKWWRRYAISGPDRLLDEARSGQPRKLAPRMQLE
jgi:transposase